MCTPADTDTTDRHEVPAYTRDTGQQDARQDTPAGPGAAPEDTPRIHLIASPATAKELAERLAGLNTEDFVAFDTEFIRSTTYTPRTALLQLAIGPDCYLIDPYETPSYYQVLTSFINTRATVLVFSGKEDYAVLAQEAMLAGLPPRQPRFLDVQLMYAFMRRGSSPGLIRVVEEQLGITMDKSETLSDWSQRPLSDAQLQYAAYDVFYLERLYRTMLPKLGARRCAWLKEESISLARAGIEDPTALDCYMGFSHTGVLSQLELTRLYFLVEQRLAYARSHDEAVNRVITTSAMPHLAAECPYIFPGLISCGVSWGCAKAHSREILKWLSKARKLKADPLLPHTYEFYTKGAHREKAQLLKEQLEKIALEAGIEDQLLTSRQLLADWVKRDEEGTAAGPGTDKKAGASAAIGGNGLADGNGVAGGNGATGRNAAADGNQENAAAQKDAAKNAHPAEPYGTECDDTAPLLLRGWRKELLEGRLNL